MAYKTVAVVGANGALGAPTIEALLAKGFDVKVLSRSGASPVSSVPGVAVDYADEAAATEALKGVDAVVSLVGVPGLEGQKTLLDAAIAAGVKRFVPSEFGSDNSDPKAKEVVILRPKQEFFDYLASKQDSISYTAIYTGAFFDWGLDHKFVADVEGHKAALFDGGKNHFTATTVADIGKAVAEVLSKPEETANRGLRIASVRTTLGDLVAAAEKATGSKFETTDQTIAEAYAKAAELITSGKFLPGALLQLQAATIGSVIGDFVDNDNALVGLEERPIEQLLDEYFAARKK